MTLIEELRWRGLIHQLTPGTEEFLADNKAIGYVGFDPTAPSLGIGNLVPLMLLVHFQRHGHQPIALVGGATGRIGDPSGKSEERNLLSEEQLEFNLVKMRDQLARFLDFDTQENPAVMANNYDWFNNMKVLDFLRDVGKHLTVNYMLSKDSVKSRMETGISFTEFSYQLIQGYDFYHLHKNMGCHLQFGGSDQWGNITAGTELIRRMMGHEEKVYAFTCPLITRADGKKYGKSEKGNIFIDAELTSPYQFYQFWINNTDEDILKLLKIFSLHPIPELEELIARQAEVPRTLQYALAEEMTQRIHGKDALERVEWASRLLFKKNAAEELAKLSNTEVEDVFAGVPTGTITRSEIEQNINIIDFLAQVGATTSKSDATRKVTKDRCISINTVKVDTSDRDLGPEDILNDHFILINTSKRNRFLVYIN
ncbi:MAG TPA: tyrosine--tRNA ligase [Bacteroidetes bacterium]|nr:tyrosine--tRNA ligase [Bacteroidota bacterium]